MFRELANLSEGTFCKNSYRLLAFSLLLFYINNWGTQLLIPSNAWLVQYTNHADIFLLPFAKSKVPKYGNAMPLFPDIKYPLR